MNSKCYVNSKIDFVSFANLVWFVVYSRQQLKLKPCIENRSQGKFRGFRISIGNRETFPVK